MGTIDRPGAALGVRWRAVTVAVLVAALAAIGLGGVVVDPAGAAGSPFRMTQFHDIVVDPGTGNVFVSGDDHVDVFDVEGIYQTGIHGIARAGGMAFVGTSLWVAERSAGNLVEIDVGNWTIARRIAVGAAIPGDSLASIGGSLHVVAGGSLRRVDPTTGAVTVLGTGMLGEFEVVDETTLLTYNRGTDSLRRVDLTTAPVTIGPYAPTGPNLQQLAVDPARSTYAYASGYPYAFPEVSTTSLTPTGVVYEGASYAVAIAHSPGRGGLFIGAASGSDKIFVAAAGAPAAVVTHQVTGDVVDRGLAASLDGTRAYVVSAPLSGSGLQLSTFPTTTSPVVQWITPSTGGVSGGTQVTLTGTGFTHAYDVSVGGSSVPFEVVSDSTITMTTPPRPLGEAEVLVTIPGATSYVYAGRTFTYVADPTTFHGMDPTRVLDSRTTNGGWNAKLVAGAPRSVVVAGRNGIPADAAAVVANLTVTDPSAETFLTAYPTGRPVPGASNLNAGAGQTVANLATVRVGRDGSISLANAAGSTNVIIDVVGYYRSGVGERFNAISPVRALDSRVGTGWSGRLGAGDAATRTLTVAGATVPATTTSVVLNVTVTDGTHDSFVQVWPTGSPRPASSNVNFRGGAVTSNLVTTKVGAGGSLSFFNAVGTTNVVADVAGYYDPSTGDTFHPLEDPVRVLDSRTELGTNQPWQADESRLVELQRYQGVPSGASALVMNTTVTGGTRASYLTVFPPGTTRPGSSSLNFSPGQTVANLTVVSVAPTTSFAVYNNLGSVEVIADAVGFFTPA